MVAADINDKTITLPAASGALLFVGDIFSGSSTGSIVAISPDLTRITLDSAPTTGPITMEAESEGLISGSGGTTVVTDGGTEFPY